MLWPGASELCEPKPHFSQYCLEEGFIRIHSRQYQEDITALGHIREYTSSIGSMGL